MTIDTKTLRSASKRNDVYKSAMQGLLAWAADHIDAQAAEIARLREALGSIRQYGNDTLSGRADGGPDDRKWQREAVIEMRNRARATLQEKSNVPTV